MLASSCEFKYLKDSLIRNRIVFSVRNENVRLRLLSEEELTVQKKLGICRASESSANQLKLRTNESPKLQDG